MTRCQALCACVLLCAIPTSTLAASDDDVAALRRQIEEMREDYEARLRALEDRVETAERKAAEAPTRADLAASSAASSDGASQAFNPAISVILQGRAAAFGREEGHRDIPGFLLGEETGVGPDGLSLSETEIDFSGNIDDLFYGFASVALNQEDGESEIELEEAYVQTLSLPQGFTVKAGRFFSDLGYLNSRHSHSWDFVDAPLAYEAMLGTQLGDTGAQLTWVAPTDTYLQLGAEILRGDGFPGGGADHDGFGSGSLFAKIGGEVGDSHSWQAGLGWLTASPRDRESEDLDDNTYVFDGSSDVILADFVWKWAPDGNARERNLTVQAEYLHRWEDGDLTWLAADGDSLRDDYHAEQDGLYLQAIYQYMPRWRIGVRYDHLWSDNDSRFGGILDDDSSQRISAMIDFTHTEFSRLRLQWNHDMGGIGGDDAVFLQYIMSLGSHGAHRF